MMKVQYVVTDPDFTVTGFCDLPLVAAVPEMAGKEVFPIDPPVAGWPTAPFAGAVLTFINGALAWRDDRTLAAARAEATAEIDRIADSFRARVVGDPVRTEEYKDALAAAEQYRDAGYTGPVPEAVQSWADAKHRDGWTPRQAADDILAAALRWHGALRYIRRTRLDAKESIKAAATGDDCNAIVLAFRTSITTAMQGVQ